MLSLLLLLALTQDVYRIQPVRPVEQLRQEALAAQPPKESGDFLPTDLVELAKLDRTIKLDIRYASTNNFLSAKMYSSPKAFLQRPAAEALVRAHRRLKAHGYGLLIHDGYRPWYVTKMFWEATPPEKRAFVADPATGSRHNRGCAVDLTLYDLKTGRAVEMPSLYDEMSPRSAPDYPGGTAGQRRLRDLLRSAMEAEGFKVFPEEWWHFDYKDWRRYRIVNVPFEKLTRARRLRGKYSAGRRCSPIATVICDSRNHLSPLFAMRKPQLLCFLKFGMMCLKTRNLRMFFDFFYPYSARPSASKRREPYNLGVRKEP